MRYVLTLLVFVAVLQCPLAHAADITTEASSAAAGVSPTAAAGDDMMVFVCLHGSVKSEMSAAHFNRIANELGLVFAFDIVPDRNRGMAEVNYWTDVPPASKDYAAARDMILRHIDDLVPALSARARPQESLKGVITTIDERNDRITLRLASNVAADFKVQDGLIFDSVRSGDAVEITVENIDGTKTIVGLKRD
jgi:Cu/Ag efflux protein CusF